MSEQFFYNNRTKFFNKMSNNSVAVLFAGEAPYKRGDELYPFSPDRNFFYVTGIEKEKCIVLFSKKDDVNNTTLYIERDNGTLAKWVGANITPVEASKVSLIEEIKYVDEFYADFAAIVFKNNLECIYLDLENRDWNKKNTPALDFSLELRKRFPAIAIKDSYPLFAELREVKEKYELALIKKAIDITALGIEEMLKNAKYDMYEYEIEAYFDYILTKNGVRQKAFQTIAASGKNGTILHYVSNQSKTKDGDLILVDAGAQFGWYNGDLTRTFPVNGKFTERQKLIYNIVLEGQKQVIDAIKPDVPFSSLNEILREFYFMELKKIGLVENKEDVSKYYYHGVSHYLGAETHDIGRYTEKNLKQGMVLTVEPGLYIEEYEMGIRIEDDVLVTESGCEVLSKGLIKTVEEIEIFMAENS